MKSAHKLLHWRLLLVVVLVLGGAITGGAPVFAATGTVTSAATPSNATPSVGQQITVAININVSGVSAPDNALGGYTGTLNWNTAVLAYNSYAGAPPTGFSGAVNTASTGSGQIAFNGANITGATDNTVVIEITFDVVAAGTSALDLSYTAMAASGTFANLLPNLTITDGSVVVPGTQYTLTVNKTGAGSGTVTSSPTGINCGADCSEAYNSGQSVTLTAAAATGSTFSGWSGEGCSGTGTCVVTMSAARTVTANFTLNTYTLTVSKTGAGSGTVTSAPTGVNCGSTCSAAFNYNQSVTLTAAAATGSTFSGWSGEGCSGTGTCVVTLSAARTVTANFAAQSGNAISSATPSNAAPSVGQQVVVTININMSGVSAPDNKLGSYSGTLNWNTAVLDYYSYSGAPPTGFTGVVNTTSTGSGQITFNGANAGGATGNTVAIQITFDVVEAGTSALDLSYSAMGAADTYADLLPRLTVNDGQVIASPAQYTLTVNKTGAGSGTVTSSPTGINCGADCSEAYNSGQSVTLTAAAATGSTFSGWSGEGCSGTGTCVVTMSAARTVTANFTLNTYTLTVNKTGAGSGTVTSSPTGINCGADCSEAYNSGQSVTLTAAAATGSTFSGWSGEGCSGTGTCVVTMSAARTVTANFTLNTYTLTVNKTGAGSGTVTSSPTGINCGADCSEAYNSGQSVTLTAAAATGSTFSGWSGEGCSGTGTCVVTMSAARTVTANFTLNTYTLTVSKTGAGSGTVTSAPTGVNCGSTCSAAFNYNQSVTLTAAAATGSTFSGWSGEGCSGTGTCVVTMSAARTVTANFTVQSGSVVSAATPSNATPSIGQQIVVSINIDMAGASAPNNALGSFTGSLAWNPAVLTYSSNSGLQAGFTGAINTASVGTGSIAFNGANTTGATGNNVVLTITFDVVGAGTSALDLGYSAMAAASTFVNLLPILTVNDGQVVAQYTLTTAVSPAGGGTIDPAVGDHAYAAGTVVPVTATPATGYTFTSWSGACTGAGACSVTMDADKTVTANFTPINYTLTTAVSPAGGGTIDPAAGPHTYAYGTVVPVTATPAAGYAFSSWSGACTGTGACSVTMDADKTVTANFTPINYTLTTAVSPAGGGTIDPAAGPHTYAYGTVVPVTATPAAGYAFSSWSGACTGTGACSVTMDADKTVTANFTQINYTLTTAVSPAGGGTTDPAAGPHAYAYGTVVAVTATPAAGYTFTSWSGACTGTGACSVTMDADKTVTANFTVQSGSVVSAATPSNATPSIGQQIVVSINIDMAGASAPNNALGSFTGSLAWNPAVLTYSSNSGLQAGFTGAINTASVGTGSIAFNGANTTGATGNNVVLTITFDVVGAGTSALDLGYSAMAAASTLTNLLPILTINDGQVVAQYTLTTAVSPAGGGTTNPAVGVHAYAAGTVVAVTATPATGYTFSSWSGACTGTGACSVTMDADKTVTANFTAIKRLYYLPLITKN